MTQDFGLQLTDFLGELGCLCEHKDRMATRVASECKTQASRLHLGPVVQVMNGQSGDRTFWVMALFASEAVDSSRSWRRMPKPRMWIVPVRLWSTRRYRDIPDLVSWTATWQGKPGANRWRGSHVDTDWVAELRALAEIRGGGRPGSCYSRQLTDS